MTPLPEVAAEAERILAAARSARVPLRLIGGLAICRQLGDELHPALRRTYRDIDVATPKRHGGEVAGFLSGIGYVADRQFNATHGARRLLFYDEQNGRQLDVFVGTFEMCHVVPITERFEVDAETIPLAELLLTKLQVVLLNEKDLRDLISILLHRPIGSGDHGEVNCDFISRLLAGDWGLWRTTQINLGRVNAGVDQYELDPAERARVRQRCAELWARIETEPKSRAWRMRNRIGDRKAWYQQPDEVA